jgi:hypothetical protein
MVTCGVGTGVGVAGMGVSPGRGVAVGSGVLVGVGTGVGVKVGVGARNGKSKGNCDRSNGIPAQPAMTNAKTNNVLDNIVFGISLGVLPNGFRMRSSLVRIGCGLDVNG